jgi:hypothetical protein
VAADIDRQVHGRSKDHVPIGKRKGRAEVENGQRASGPAAFFHASMPPLMWQAEVRPASCAACTAIAERSPNAQ